MKKIVDLFSLWVPVFLYLGLIFYLSSLTDPPQPELEIPFLDKFEHLILYAGLGMLIYRAIFFTWGEISYLWLVVTVLVVLYGVSDEFHQSLVPLRDADVFDVVFDGLGGFLATQVGFIKRLATRPILLTSNIEDRNSFRTINSNYSD